MVSYKCFDIVAEDGTSCEDCIIVVPEHNMNSAMERQEHLMYVSDALENTVGSVESFRYERMTA